MARNSQCYVHHFHHSFLHLPFPWSPRQLSQERRKNYAPLSYINFWVSDLSRREEVKKSAAPLKSPSLPLRIISLRGLRGLQRCLLLWSTGRSSAATRTSSACLGRAVCPKARRRNRCVGSVTMRRAGSPPATAEESWGSRSPPATADGTDRLLRGSTSTWEDTTVRWDERSASLLMSIKLFYYVICHNCKFQNL